VPDEERVEVRRGAGLGSGGGGAGQGEVEQDQVLGAVAAAFPYAQVGRFDVAVVDPGPVQRDEAVEQVRPVALQQVE
jgi:hypothetical protein